MAKESKKTRSESNKRYFSAYNAKAAKNKERRQKRHMKAHPNDKQSASANPANYSRKRPQVKGGWINRNQAEEHDMGQGSANLVELTTGAAMKYVKVTSKIRGMRKAEQFNGGRRQATNEEVRAQIKGLK